MVTQSPLDDGLDMAQLLEEAESSYTTLERNQVVDGVVMQVEKDGILVNVGQKTEGVVPAREMRSMSPEDLGNLQVGDPILVAVIRPESDDGQAVLSLDRARGEVGWRKLQEYADAGTVVDAEVTGYNKGGAVVLVENVQGFVPMSQLTSVSRPPADSTENPELQALVGETLRLKVIEVNRRRNRAILSQRAAMHEARQAQKSRLLEELRVGSRCHGRVSGITNFGAFVDLGGADGLIHISELSWHSVRSADEVVQVGQDVEVEVVKIDRESQRIALSLKRTQAEPWVEVAEKYAVGEITEAVITKLANFGAFAKVDDAVEGLIHISEMTDRIIQHPKEVVREGDRVAVKIVRLEPERRRIGLSLKQVQEAEASQVLETFRGEGEHRVERPALGADLAAQLAKAVSAQEAARAEEPATSEAEAPTEEPATMEADPPAEEPAMSEPEAQAEEPATMEADPPADEPAMSEPEAQAEEPATMEADAPAEEPAMSEPEAQAEEPATSEAEAQAEEPVMSEPESVTPVEQALASSEEPTENPAGEAQGEETSSDERQ